MSELEILSEREIRDRLFNAVVARTDLTDLNDSSAVKRVLTATAAELAECYYMLTRLREMFGLRAVGGDLDERVGDFPTGLEARRGPRFSVGRLTFSAGSAVAEDTTIPVGTMVVGPTGLTYISLGTATIATGDTVSNSVLAKATNTGEEFDADAATVVTFAGSPPLGVSSVTNSSAFRGGRSAESDDSLRRRMQNFVASLSKASLTAMQEALLDLEDTSSGQTISYAFGLTDPGTPGLAYIYIDDGDGTIETTAAFTDVSLLATALGGEQYFQLPTGDWPVKLEAGVTMALTRGVSTLTPVLGTDFIVNPATGVVYFYDPAYIQAGDTDLLISGTAYTGLIREAQRIVSGDRSDRINYPGMEASGTTTRVLPVVVEDISVVGTVILASNSPDGALERATQRVIDYVNSISGGADGSINYVVRSEIIGAVMAEPGIFDLVLTSPANNTPISPGHRARATTGTVSLTE